MKIRSDKEKTILKWTSNDEYRNNYDEIFKKKDYNSIEVEDGEEKSDEVD